MMHGWMMAAAIGAAAPEAPVEPFGAAGSVVLGELVAARAMTVAPMGAGALGGGAGQLTAGWLSVGATRTGDTTMRHVFAEPAIDVFVADGFSLGAVIGGGMTSFATQSPSFSSEAWHLSAMPRVGSTIDLAGDIALWPRFGAGLTLFDGPGQLRTGTVLRAVFDAPFVFRLGRRVVLQTGPQLTYFNHVSGPFDMRGFGGGVSAGLSIVL